MFCGCLQPARLHCLVGFTIRNNFYLPRYKSLPIILHGGKWTATGKYCTTLSIECKWRDMSCKLQSTDPTSFFLEISHFFFFVQLDHSLINRKLSTDSLLVMGYIQNGSQTVHKMPNVLTRVDQFADQTLHKVIRQLTWVQVYACSAVHSECEVGFDSEKMIGLCIYN